MPFFCYLLECNNGTYYCGWCVNVEKRTKEHNRGRGAKYTRMHLPVQLVYYEELPNRSDAMHREHQIKKISHLEKRHLIEGFHHD